jgi:hypothetical protein
LFFFSNSLAASILILLRSMSTFSPILDIFNYIIISM